MSEKSDFALVPKPPGSLGKAEPGAKRILSGMVADTLALVRKEPSPPRIVVVNDNPPVLEAWGVMIRHWSKDATLELFEGPIEAWQELSQTDPDLLITAVAMSGLRGKDIVQRLMDRKVTYPIIVISAYEPEKLWVREFASKGLNVSFLAMPFDFKSLRKLLDAGLKRPHDTIEKPVEIVPQPRGTRPLRIVISDDEDWRTELLDKAIRAKFERVVIDVFQNGDLAWQELMRADPDLLITTLCIKRGLNGFDLVSRLAEKKAKYPVLVYDGLMDKPGEDHVLRLAGSNVNVTCLYFPFTLEQFYRALSKLLGHDEEGHAERPIQNSTKSLTQRPLRIVINDDEEGCRVSYSLMLKWSYDGIEILTFNDSRDTWRELSRADPDLLITDIHHALISGPDLLSRLAERKVKYPILVISAGLDMYGEDERRSWGPGLNVSFLSKPVGLETLRTAVETALQIPARRKP